MINSKTIKLNPIFLGSGAKTNKTRKEKPTGVSLNQSNAMKKKLITRIKNFQQGSVKPNKVDATTAGEDQTDLNDAFGDSVQFLNTLALGNEERKKIKKNETLKKKQANTNNYSIATELPPELNWDVILPPKPIAITTAPVPTTSHVPTTSPVPTTSHVPIATSNAPVPTSLYVPAPPPSYSNLKSGTKPTYRTWLRNTQKNKPTINKPIINILENIEPVNVDNAQTDATDATDSIDAYAKVQEPAPSVGPSVGPSVANTAPYTPTFAPKRKRITRTLKYKLGKHTNGKVSVLIKNSQTRRKVQTEQALLKQKNIVEIKNYLRGKNLLKVGSDAPNDVLRQLYEQSILAGQIENKSKDTLIHNYFNDEKK